MGKLKIKKKVGGAKPDVKFTLSDNICAPVAGLSEKDKLELIRNSSTAKQIPKVRLCEGLGNLEIRLWFIAGAHVQGLKH